MIKNPVSLITVSKTISSNAIPSMEKWYFSLKFLAYL